MKDLLKALGLSDAASEADALTAVAALKAATVAAMTAKPATPPDPALYAPAETVVALQAKVAELHAAMTASTLEDMVQSGMADGRILPDLEAWARTLNVAALKGFLEKAKPIAALSGLQTAGIKPTATTAATADVETAMRIGGWDAAVFTPKKD
jgi:phage I-like protein